MALKHTASSDINSSFTIFFVISSVAWAFVFSNYFPADFHALSLLLSLFFALMLYIFKFFLNQFYDGVTILRMIFLYFCLSACMAFLSAVKGPIANGTIPVIQFLWFGPYVYSSAVPSLIVASVFTFYGGITLLSSLMSSLFLEGLYTGLVKIMPKKIMNILYRTDSEIDKASFKASTYLFWMSNYRGIVAACVVLASYSLAYTLLLIFYS
jgi:hypothetical protein